MQLTKKGTPIREWLNNRSHIPSIVRNLSINTGLTTQTIYMYAESERDIRVIVNGKKTEIYEIKRLDK